MAAQSAAPAQSTATTSPTASSKSTLRAARARRACASAWLPGLTTRRLVRPSRRLTSLLATHRHLMLRIRCSARIATGCDREYPSEGGDGGVADVLRLGHGSVAFPSRNVQDVQLSVKLRGSYLSERGVLSLRGVWAVQWLEGGLRLQAMQEKVHRTRLSKTQPCKTNQTSLSIFPSQHASSRNRVRESTHTHTHTHTLPFPHHEPFPTTYPPRYQTSRAKPPNLILPPRLPLVSPNLASRSPQALHLRQKPHVDR
jgi:hypothetical protein